MKKLYSLLVAATLGLQVSHAAVVSQELAVAGKFTLLSAAAVIESVVVMPAGTNMTCSLYDASNTNLVYTNLVAYTNYVEYTTNYVSSFIGATGLTNTFTNTVLWRAPQVYAVDTNIAVPKIASYAVINGTLLQDDTDRVVSRGLVITNSHACSVIVNYRAP